MWVIIIAVIVVFILALKNSKKSEQSKAVDENELPETLTELRKVRNKNFGKPVWYQCSKKISEVGMALYNEGKLVVDPSSEYNVKTLLEEMIDLAEKSGGYTYIPHDDAVEFACLHNASIIATDFIQKEPAQAVFPNNYYYVWPNLADYYTQGRGCKRDPEAARLNWRQHITYIQQSKLDIPDDGINGLMEIPAAGEYGKAEINKWLALKYGLDAVKVAQGQHIYNRSAQPLQQCAELLFEMDLSQIGGSDIRAMLNEYEKCAAKENAYAQYKLGQFYLEGRYVVKNEEVGISYLEQAASQDLYEAVRMLSDHYYRLANPYAGDYGDYTKAEIAEFKRLDSKWSEMCDKLLPKVAAEFENSFKEYVPNAYSNIPSASFPEEEDDSSSEYSQDQADNDAIFSVIDMPDVICDADDNCYIKSNLSVTSVEYTSKFRTITIHDSDIKFGFLGYSAENSDGYFHWN